MKLPGNLESIKMRFKTRKEESKHSVALLIPSLTSSKPREKHMKKLSTI